MSNGYVFAPERRAEVDAALGRIEHYLTALAQELYDAAPLNQKSSHSWESALETRRQVASLRSLLTQRLLSLSRASTVNA
jgi:hypothetical protein